MVDPPPTHIRNVQQPVNSTQVDKGAKVGDVFHRTATNLTFFERFQKLGFLFGSFGFDQAPAAYHNITPRLVDLENQTLNRSTDVIADVVGTTDVDLASRQEHVHANVHQQTALDLAGHRTCDHVILMDRLHDLQPGLDLFGLALAEENHATFIFVACAIL